MAAHTAKERGSKPAYTLRPTADQSFELDGQGPYHFSRRLKLSEELQRNGQVREACEARYEAVQLLMELLPDDEAINLNWEHANSRAAIELTYRSAIDHFLVADYEMAAALVEATLDLDPEDHLEASTLLGFLYPKLEEWELYDEILFDIPESPSRSILLLWGEFLRTGELNPQELRTLKQRHGAYFSEFCRAEHPADEEYLRAIESERPSVEARARELWLQTENLWTEHPDFIAKLVASK